MSDQVRECGEKTRLCKSSIKNTADFNTTARASGGRAPQASAVEDDGENAILDGTKLALETGRGAAGDDGALAALAAGEGSKVNPLDAGAWGRRVRSGDEVVVSCDVPFVADFALIFLWNSVGKRLCSLCDVLLVDLNR